MMDIVFYEDFDTALLRLALSFRMDQRRLLTLIRICVALYLSHCGAIRRCFAPCKSMPNLEQSSGVTGPTLTLTYSTATLSRHGWKMRSCASPE